jgi:hypothetical protein
VSPPHPRPPVTQAHDIEGHSTPHLIYTSAPVATASMAATPGPVDTLSHPLWHAGPPTMHHPASDPLGLAPADPYAYTAAHPPLGEGAISLGWAGDSYGWPRTHDAAMPLSAGLPHTPGLYPLPGDGGAYSSSAPASAASSFPRSFAEAGATAAWRPSKGHEAWDIDAYPIDYHSVGSPAYPLHDDPYVDLRYPIPHVGSNVRQLEQDPARRPSLSSFSGSSRAPTVDMPAVSEAPVGLERPASMPAIAPSVTNETQAPALTLPSPPRRSLQRTSARSAKRGRASASPRLSIHTAGHDAGAGRTNRWSTGSFAPSRPHPDGSPPLFHPTAGFHQAGAHHLSLQSSPVTPHTPQSGLSFSSQPMQMHQHAYLAVAPSFPLSRPNTLYPPPLHTRSYQPQLDAPRLLPSQDYLGSRHADVGVSQAYQEGSDQLAAPDLFAPLLLEPSAPPPEDMNTSDPDMVPHEQDLRFEGDLYTPRWVRGQGNKREGWCGICKPGRWLVLKNSAFWYDKSFSHGVSAATGAPFQGPQATRRMDGNPDVWEGFCGGCHDWVALVSSKKKGTTWFRHAYKVKSFPLFLCSLRLTQSSLALFQSTGSRRRAASHSEILSSIFFSLPPQTDGVLQCHAHPKPKEAPKRKRERSDNLLDTLDTPASPSPKRAKVPPPSTPTPSPHLQRVKVQPPSPTASATTSVAGTPTFPASPYFPPTSAPPSI